MTFQEFCDKLEAKIIASYETGVSMEEAERLASEFLAAQLRVSTELTKADLDARMRKTGSKSIKAAAYMDTLTSETKLTEAGKAAVVDLDKYVITSQKELDVSEVTRDEYQRYYNIFQAAHVHYRNVAKGAFGG